MLPSSPQRGRSSAKDAPPRAERSISAGTSFPRVVFWLFFMRLLFRFLSPMFPRLCLSLVRLCANTKKLCIAARTKTWSLQGQPIRVYAGLMIMIPSTPRRAQGSWTLWSLDFESFLHTLRSQPRISYFGKARMLRICNPDI